MLRFSTVVSSFYLKLVHHVSALLNYPDRNLFWIVTKTLKVITCCNVPMFCWSLGTWLTWQAWLSRVQVPKSACLSFLASRQPVHVHSDDGLLTHWDLGSKRKNLINQNVSPSILIGQSFKRQRHQFPLTIHTFYPSPKGIFINGHVCMQYCTRIKRRWSIHIVST